MRVYGLMIARDDGDIFADWCREQLGLYDAVVCLDGSTTDEAARVASAHADRLVYLHERDFAVARKTDHGLRGVAHDEIIRRFGSGHWVMCCHADEFCYHDPRLIAARAERGGYDLVSWFSPHFYPHPADRSDWPRLESLPVPERVRHYHWSYQGDGYPWAEDRLYRCGPGVGWDGVTHGSVRPLGLRRPAPFHPILCHYKVYSIDPGGFDVVGNASHYRHHWVGQEHRTGVPFPVRHGRDLFVAMVSPYTRCDRFDGTFPHAWNMGEEYRVRCRRAETDQPLVGLSRDATAAVEALRPGPTEAWLHVGRPLKVRGLAEDVVAPREPDRC